MGEPAPNLPRPGTPPSRLKRGRKKVALENLAGSPVPVATPANGSDRRVRHRTDSGSPTQEAGSITAPFPGEASHGDFRVFLPNATFVEVRVDGAILKNLKVKTFVELVHSYNEESKNSDTKAREIQWSSDVYIQDFRGHPVEDGGFIKLVDEIKADKGLFLYDNHPDDTVHSHPDFWNITPEGYMIASGMPQDYTLFSALADELDNSLQAVYQLQPGKTRLICVNLDHLNGKISIYDTGKGMDSSSQNSISKWGTLGASMNRHDRSEAIGGRPPYLKPNFGMYGFGAIGAGFHLGGSISVSSKTEASKRVAILHLVEKTLTTTTPGRPWKTPGEYRQPTPKELELSPHGSFTKVEISNLKGVIPTWKVADVQRKLKDYYFPYIQNDEGSGGTTSTPVEIRVNGVNLAEVLGGEVAHTNYYSGNGEPYVLILKLIKNRTTPGDNDTPTEANARITCRYFPITQGREAIDNIIGKLAEEDPEFMEVNFEKFPRRSIRRLGRLLPDSQEEKPLPFMERKKTVKPNAVNKHCYKRVKAFIDVDAGFTPNKTKMDLDKCDDFSKALLALGSAGQSRGSGRLTYSEPGPVTVSIQRDGDVIQLKDLSDDYEKWIASQHDEYDTGPIFDESDVFIVNNARHRKELNIVDEVFQVVYGIKCRGNIDWKVGKEKPPVHLKLERGIPNLNNNDKVLYVTVECFISGGFADHPGEARIICRPMEVPEERGSKEIKVEGQDTDFVLGESRAFPIEDVLFSNKYEKIEEDLWLKRIEKMWSESPGFVELLNDQEALKLNRHESIPKFSSGEAGRTLPTEIIAVVRPRLCKHRDKLRDSTLEAPRLEQKFIISEAMEMKLVVRGMKYHSQEVKFPKRAMEEAEITHETKISASTNGTLKGLYIFNTKHMESITKKCGTYFFFFTLVSAKYKDVDDFIVRINVSPSSRIGNWNICSHPGDCIEHHKNQSPEVTKLRLGRVRPRHLYLSRVDEFGNSMTFERIPSDIACSIYTVEGNQVAISTTVAKDSLKISNDKINLEIPVIAGEGNLAPLKPTMQAVLKMTIADVPVASFQISVLPGEVSSARIKESSEAPDNRLHPGQIIEQIVFEVLDKCQNPVSSGQKVKVVLEGFALQDKNGLERSVDGNGCLDLGMRLRVTSGYGEAARVELRSTENLSLLEKTFTIMKRSLQVKNVPKRIPVGSRLEGIEIEALDENLEVDHRMSGKDHTLTLSWDLRIMVPLLQGRGTLQPIPMLSHEGIWKGYVSHTHYPSLQTVIEVEVVKKVKIERVEVTNTMAETDPYDVVGSPVTVPNNPVSDSSLAGYARLKSLCQAFREEVLRLDSKIQRLSTKMIKQNGDLDILKQMQRKYEESNQQYCAEIDSLKVIALETSTIYSEEEDPVNTPYIRITKKNQEALYDPSMDGNELLEPYKANEKYPGILGCTANEVQMQIAKLGDPPGTNAATILLEAKHEQHSEILQDIIGIVALLGAVETEELNRALVEFLGLENMLAIICRSRSAAEYIGLPSIDRVLDKNKGLRGFGSSRNLKISGRFRVITLTNESSFFKRVDGQPAVDNTHPQKLLNMGPINERPKGSRGYAVNMIQLNEEQLQTRISGHHGLRESLFFVLFGFLEVFDTTEDMLRAQKDIRSSAVSLDGGLIRTNNQFELGSREDPVVWFPTWIPPVNFEQPSSSLTHERSLVLAPQPLQSITPLKLARPVQHLKRKVKDGEAKMREIKRQYINEKVEEKIEIFTKLIQLTKEKLIAAEQRKEESEEKFRSLPEFERITELRLEAETLNFEFDERTMDNPRIKVEPSSQV